jgi:tRNA (mo5U34)-methyltransferase
MRFNPLSGKFRKKFLSPSDSEERVRQLGWWYQYFQLPSGVWTGRGTPPSYRPEERWRLIEPFIPADLSDQTVLDVGSNAGYFSVQMKKRGAKRCVLVEPYVEFARQASFVAESFKMDLEIVNEDVHTYCLTTEERFDYVLFLGLFYHLKYPGLVLDRLSEMTRKYMFFQCIVSDAPENETPPNLAFLEGPYKDDPTNWWIPSYSALEPMLRSSGMKITGRPHPEILVAEPEEYFGKVVHRKLVFPRYGKRGGAKFPGTQTVEPSLWQELLRKGAERKD